MTTPTQTSARTSTVTLCFVSQRRQSFFFTNKFSCPQNENRRRFKCPNKWLMFWFCRLHHRSSSFTPVISQSAFVASLPHSSPSDLSYNWRLIVNSFSEVSRSLTLFSFMCFYSIYIFFSCFSFTVTSRTCWVFYFLRFCPPTSRNIKSASWVIRIHCTVAAFMQVKCDLKH